ncbi:MAG: ParB/RepB/Spo0J family partition protein [Chthoniobacterales bacterium]
MAHSKIAAGPIGVKQVRTAKLFANPHNPRWLFDRKPMEVLRQSIERVGILVPLTVYWEKAKKRYVILDGQRRWMCARVVGLKEVPVNQVPEPSLVQNIVTMFQIHKLREDWELMPTALKVQVLMEETGDKNNARLSELTGLEEAVIVRCKKLISYDRKFQDMMLDPDPDRRVKSDFFIELYAVTHDKEVANFTWFSRKRFARQMLVKYQEEPRTIKAVTDFRLIKQHITNAKRIKAMPIFSRRLQKFAEDRTIPLNFLEIEEASVHAEAKALTKKIASVQSLVAELDTQQFYGEEELWQAMSQLVEILQKKLKQADKLR